MRWHVAGLVFSAALTVLTIGLFVTKGLNYGIDFIGGTLIEARVSPGRRIWRRCGARSTRCAWASRHCRRLQPQRRVIDCPQSRVAMRSAKAIQAVRDALGTVVDYRASRSSARASQRIDSRPAFLRQFWRSARS